jgi:hypothetical protein
MKISDRTLKLHLIKLIRSGAKPEDVLPNFTDKENAEVLRNLREIRDAANKLPDYHERHAKGLLTQKEVEWMVEWTRLLRAT